MGISSTILVLPAHFLLPSKAQPTSSAITFQIFTTTNNFTNNLPPIFYFYDILSSKSFFQIFTSMIYSQQSHQKAFSKFLLLRYPVNNLIKKISSICLYSINNPVNNRPPNLFTFFPLFCYNPTREFESIKFRFPYGSQNSNFHFQQPHILAARHLDGKELESLTKICGSTTYNRGSSSLYWHSSIVAQWTGNTRNKVHKRKSNLICLVLKEEEECRH